MSGREALGMRELDERVSTREFDQDGACALTAATRHGDTLTVVLDLNFPTATGERSSENWEIVANGVLDHRVRLGSFSHPLLGLGREHKLVAPYVEEAVELTFNGRTGNEQHLMGALLEAHARWASGWFAFETFCRGNVDLLAGGLGQLAIGPRSLISELAAVLRSRGVIASEVLLPGGCALSVAGATCARPGFDPEAAVFAGYFDNLSSSYVIARELTARRVDAGRRAI